MVVSDLGLYYRNMFSVNNEACGYEDLLSVLSEIKNDLWRTNVKDESGKKKAGQKRNLDDW